MFNKIKNRLMVNNRRPIIDLSIGGLLAAGYTSGNLMGINCLVAGKWKTTAQIEITLKSEQANVDHIEFEMITGIDSIIKNASSIIGPYDRIFNVFEINDRSCIDQIQSCYAVLQAEVNYLVSLREGYTTSIVCTFIDGTNDSKAEVKDSLKNFVMGLSEQVGRHNIVINEIFADDTVSLEVIAKWNCFLGSKFGHILAGESIELANI